MEQFGEVIENKGDVSVVTLQRHLACEKCGKCGSLSETGKRRIEIEALNPINAEIGNRVMLESDDNQVLFITFMLYIFPLGGLVAGIFIWLNLLAPYFGLSGSQDLPAVLAGLALMAVFFVFIRIWDRRVKDDPKYKPVITQIIESEPETDCETDDNR